MNCLHCCENSGCHEPANFMPLEKFEQYLNEFQKLSFDTSEHIVIGGGEGMAPYLLGKRHYIPQALGHIQKAGLIPTIKTNAMWGARRNFSMEILKDLADNAFYFDRLVTLDISVDEFHNNINNAANVIENTLSNPHFMYGIRICLTGFNTSKSADALRKLKQELMRRNLFVSDLPDGQWGVYNSLGYGFCVYLDYKSSIYNLGRASDNMVYNALWMPNWSMDSENCLVIDNNDVAKLNYQYSEKISGRKMQTVVENLVRKYGD